MPSPCGLLPGETPGGGTHSLEGLPGVRPGWHQPLEGPDFKRDGAGVDAPEIMSCGEEKGVG